MAFLAPVRSCKAERLTGTGFSKGMLRPRGQEAAQQHRHHNRCNKTIQTTLQGHVFCVYILYVYIPFNPQALRKQISDLSDLHSPSRKDGDHALLAEAAICCNVFVLTKVGKAYANGPWVSFGLVKEFEWKVSFTGHQASAFV